jgi:hypothetical protein
MFGTKVSELPVLKIHYVLCCCIWGFESFQFEFNLKFRTNVVIFSLFAFLQISNVVRVDSEVLSPAPSWPSLCYLTCEFIITHHSVSPPFLPWSYHLFVYIIVLLMIIFKISRSLLYRIKLYFLKCIICDESFRKLSVTSHPKSKGFHFPEVLRQGCTNPGRRRLW